MAIDIRMYTREGCRGGQEQFSWKALHEQDFKDREQYLGVSTKVGLMSKFGKYYVHDWYAHKRDSAESIEDERADVQKYEEELMQEALGLKPKKLLLQKKQMSDEEIKEWLRPSSEKGADKQGREMMGPQKGTMMTDAQGQEVEGHVLFADSVVKGLGFAAHRNAKLEKYKAETLGTESKLEGIKSEGVKSEIKMEVKNELMTDTDRMRLGGSSSSSSGFKKEEQDLKQEVKPEAEVKNEPTAAQGTASKRPLEDAEAESKTAEDKKQKKAEKKGKKKKDKKKAEKKAKKKVKKALRKEKKAAKLAAKIASGRKVASPSSDSSSSSS